MDWHIDRSDYWAFGIEACFDRSIMGCYEANLMVGPWRIGVTWGWL